MIRKKSVKFFFQANFLKIFEFLAGCLPFTEPKTLVQRNYRKLQILLKKD